MLISWNTTKRCNLYCRHCYRDSTPDADIHNELTTEEGIRLIKEIKAAGFRLLILSGGEPLLRDDMLTLVKATAAAGLIPAMGSNGTLLTPQLARDLKEAGLQGIAISIDSLDDQYHDSFRGMPGALAAAQAGIDHALAADLRVQINLTLTEHNRDQFEQIADYYADKGVHALHPFFLVPTGRALSMEDDSLKKQAYYAMIQAVLEKQSSCPIELKPTCAPQFMPMAKELCLPQRFTRGCLAGTGYCCILPQGEVHICPYLPVLAGNVREQSFDHIWQHSPVFNKLRDFTAYGGACGHCPHIDICGGCRARAYYYSSGDYLAEEPWCYRRDTSACN